MKPTRGTTVWIKSPVMESINGKMDGPTKEILIMISEQDLANSTKAKSSSIKATGKMDNKPMNRNIVKIHSIYLLLKPSPKPPLKSTTANPEAHKNSLDTMISEYISIHNRNSTNPGAIDQPPKEKPNLIIPMNWVQSAIKTNLSSKKDHNLLTTLLVAVMPKDQPLHNVTQQKTKINSLMI
jgi:hypothetical protein